MKFRVGKWRNRNRLVGLASLELGLMMRIIHHRSSELSANLNFVGPHDGVPLEIDGLSVNQESGGDSVDLEDYDFDDNNLT